jgi:hypothetical protein
MASYTIIYLNPDNTLRCVFQTLAANDRHARILAHQALGGRRSDIEIWHGDVSVWSGEISAGNDCADARPQPDRRQPQTRQTPKVAAGLSLSRDARGAWL